MKYTCPKCGAKNDDNWPVDVDGKIKNGGCQMCFEEQCDAGWWELIDLLYEINKAEELNKQ